MSKQSLDTDKYSLNAAEVSLLLKYLSNEYRIIVIFLLMKWGDASIDSLSRATKLSKSHLLYHLNDMQNGNILTCRYDSQILRYKIADIRIEYFFSEICNSFCCDLENSTVSNGNNKPNTYCVKN